MRVVQDVFRMSNIRSIYVFCSVDKYMLKANSKRVKTFLMKILENTAEFIVTVLKNIGMQVLEQTSFCKFYPIP